MAYPQNSQEISQYLSMKLLLEKEIIIFLISSGKSSEKKRILLQHMGGGQFFQGHGSLSSSYPIMPCFQEKSFTQTAPVSDLEVINMKDESGPQ